MARLTQRAAKAQAAPPPKCQTCGWNDRELPGACCAEGCGLRGDIHAARNATRAKLGLPELPASAPDKPRRVTARKLRPAPRRQPVCAPADAEPTVDAPPGGVRLGDLQGRSCRWPLGDPRRADFRFCGARNAAPGQPYCAAHAQVAWDRPEREAAT